MSDWTNHEVWCRVSLNKVIFTVVSAQSKNYQITKKPLNVHQNSCWRWSSLHFDSLTYKHNVHQHSNYFVWKPNKRMLMLFQLLRNIPTVTTAGMGCRRNITLVRVLELVGRNTFLSEFSSPYFFQPLFEFIFFFNKIIKIFLPTLGRCFIFNKDQKWISKNALIKWRRRKDE